MPRPEILLLVLAFVLAAAPNVAFAYAGPHARVKSICLRERVVLQPQRTADATNVATKQPIRLVRVSFCDLSRPACFAGDDEVSMSLCKKPG